MLRPLSFLGALALLPAVAQAAPAKCLAGQYDGSATEIAAMLMLSPEGRFRYALSYGALDEQAQGRWDSEGGRVMLTSDPVTPPRFALVQESPSTANEFHLALDLPDGISPQFFNALLTLSDGSTAGSPLGYQTWVVPLKPGQTVVAVKFQLPVLDIESERIPVTQGSASEARFVFEPNDLGQVAFAQEPLTIDGRDLTIARHGRELRFRPQTGGC